MQRDSSPRPSSIAGVWHWLLALTDQALVSGTRFLTTIIVGRWCGPAELGTYSLAFSVLVLAGCFQEAILTTPYAVLSPRLRKRSRETYAGAVARMHVVALLGCIVVLLGLALVAFCLQYETLATVSLTLAITLPGSLAAEFARRFALAHLEVRCATLLDGAIAVLQLALLVSLAELQWLNGVAGLVVIGVACLLPALCWWALFARTRIRAAHSAGRYWGRNWSLGRWLVASQLTGAVHGLMPAWLLALLVDTRATGQFAACLNLALLANPLIFAVANLLTPRAAKRLAHGNSRDVQHVVFHVQLYLVAVLASFALVLSVWGGQFIRMIYGSSFIGAAQVAGLLGLAATMWAISATCACGLTVLGRPRWSFVASGSGTIVSAISIALLAPAWAVYGASLGLVLGSTTAAAIHAVAFVRVSEDSALNVCRRRNLSMNAGSRRGI